MRERAFTLVELLVVVAVMGLLVAILLPQLDAARSLARAAICKNNLHQIANGFRAAARAEDAGRDAPTAYPAPQQFPAVPYSHLGKEATFICPEDDAGDWQIGPNLEWRYGSYTGRFVDGYMCGGYRVCRSRRGCDEDGNWYTEYVFEDNPRWSELQTLFRTEHPNYPNDPGYSDNDGIYRLYDDHPKGGKLMRMQFVTCGMDNRAYAFDKPMFGVDERVGLHLGDEIILGSIYTSYAINAKVARHEVAPETVVAMDYEHSDQDVGFVADPDSPHLPARLDASGRHLGRVHVLRADDSVEAIYPVELYPQAGIVRWSP